MPAENPFGDIDRQYAETLKKHSELAHELDAMEEDVTSWEAEFLESIILRLDEKKLALTQKQIERLYELCDKYDIDRDED